METLSDFVKCLICGYELSGTTALSELVRHHPEVDGRFEVGRMLFDDGAAYRNSVYSGFLEQYWEVAEEGRLRLFEAKGLREFYLLLREVSSIASNTRFIYDKTPRYMLDLARILEGCDLKALVNVRDPRAVYFSMRERDPSLTLDGFLQHYRSYAEGYIKAKSLFPNRVMLVKHEQLCLDPNGIGSEIYRFIDLEFRPSFLKFESKYRLHTNVRGELGPIRMLRFQQGLDDSSQNRILEELVDWKDWFYPDEISASYLHG